MRLRELLKERNVSQKELAAALTIDKSTMSLYVNERRTPDLATVVRMAKYFDVSVDYLLGHEEEKKEAPSNDGKWIPVIGRVSAGIAIEAIEQYPECIDDWEQIDPHMAEDGFDYFGLRIQGDSMEPKISDGDIVIVRKQNSVQDDDVAVVLVNDSDATVKRVKRTDDGLWLIPNNTAYHPVFYDRSEIKTLPVKILGRVVELRAKF